VDDKSEGLIVALLEPPR